MRYRACRIYYPYAKDASLRQLSLSNVSLYVAFSSHARNMGGGREGGPVRGIVPRLALFCFALVEVSSREPVPLFYVMDQSTVALE